MLPGTFVRRMRGRLGQVQKLLVVSAQAAAPAAPPVEVDERKKLHDALRDDLFKRQLSNSENLDKAILTLSSAALGLSLTFLKDFVPSVQPAAAWLLYLSWYLFGCAVVVTVLSFLSSQRGIAKRLKQNEKYYLERNDRVLTETNFFADVTDWLSYLSAFVFISAVVCTIIFVQTNVERRTAMSKDAKGFGQDGAPVPNLQELQTPDAVKGAPVPKPQPVPPAPPSSATPPSGAKPSRIPLTDGAPVPGMQRMPPAPPPAAPPSTGSSSGVSPATRPGSIGGRGGTFGGKP
jgi:hypothetical protein